MKTRGILISAVVSLGIVCAWGARADVTTLQPMTVAGGGSGNYHDAFIVATGGGGSGQGFGVIGTQGGGYNNRYLVQFDQLNSWIGGADKVTNATLALMFNSAVYDSPFSPTPQIQVFRLTNSWQNGASWTSRGGLLGSWIAAGGDYDPTPVATLAFPAAPANNTLVSWDVTGLVSNWVAGAYPNDGLLLKWDIEGNITGTLRWYGFVGPDGPNPIYGTGYVAPSLTFATIPESSAAISVFMACVAGWVRWIRRSRS